MPEAIVVYSDSDWGGDLKTRKSTSGGCIVLGSHLVMHWSRTQQTIALSSCEAELNALCKALQEGLGAKHMLEELDNHMRLHVMTDSSAAQGVVLRQGTGKVTHFSVRQLWVQSFAAG